MSELSEQFDAMESMGAAVQKVMLSPNDDGSAPDRAIIFLLGEQTVAEYLAVIQAAEARWEAEDGGAALEEKP